MCFASSSVEWWLFLCGRKGTFVEEWLRFKIEFELGLWGCDVLEGLGASSIRIRFTGFGVLEVGLVASECGAMVVLLVGCWW